MSPDSVTGESGDARSRLVDALRAEPPRTAILTDVDGTLAPIVEKAPMTSPSRRLTLPYPYCR